LGGIRENPLIKAPKRTCFNWCGRYPDPHHKEAGSRKQFGLIAEGVEKVNPDLVARDEGNVTTVRYEAVNAMLLNEFLKEHRNVEAQERKVQAQVTTTIKLESTVAKQNEMIAKQQNQIEALTATVQKVSEKLALTKLARS
jgi:uncharacterized coiled-coil protein SlyX